MGWWLQWSIASLKTRNSYVYVHLLLALVKNTSLTASTVVLEYLYISTFFVLKITLILTFLLPAGSLSDGTESIPTYGVPAVGASQTLKSSGTA